MKKSTLKEFKDYLSEEELKKFKDEYGIIDEGNIVPEDDLITDKKLVNKED